MSVVNAGDRHKEAPFDPANDIAFSLLFDANAMQQCLPAFLPCQCVAPELNGGANSIESGGESVDLPGLSLLLSFSSQAELAGLLPKVFDQSLPCILRLRYLETEIEVSGSCYSFDVATSVIQFIFTEPGSMQAKMILQLVKICQMKAELCKEQGKALHNELNQSLNEGPDKSIDYVAKCWANEFAADFSENFDKNK